MDSKFNSKAESIVDSENRPFFEDSKSLKTKNSPFKKYYSIMVGLLYCGASVSAVFLNKIILSRNGSFKDFSSVEILMTFQSLIAVVVLLFFRHFNIISFTISVGISKIIQIGFLSVLFVIMTGSNAYSVKFLSMPMVGLFKNSQVVIVCILEAIFLKNIPSFFVVGSLMVIVLGSVFGSLTDLEFDLVGYISVAFSVLSSAFYLVYIKIILRNSSISEMTLVLFNNILSVCFVIG